MLPLANPAWMGHVLYRRKDCGGLAGTTQLRPIRFSGVKKTPERRGSVAGQNVGKSFRKGAGGGDHSIVPVSTDVWGLQ